MNIQLIQHNLKMIDEYVQTGRGVEAGRLALLLAKMMLEKPDGGQMDAAAKRGLYGAYGGAAVSLKECFDMLLQDYSPTDDMEQLKEKIARINDRISQCIVDIEEIEQNNSELFAAEAELRKKQDELKEKRDKLQELKDLKEKGLSDLKKEIDELDETLNTLNEECSKALNEKEKWAEAFTINRQLIAELPESVADKTADELIAAAKEYAARVQQTGSEGEEWLIKVIDAVEGIRERMKNSAQA
ncbi:MAG: hypothetical protein IJE08_13470 [Clostridia bacterium]|nr:hypothetical protein [Clostridia bacterium]